MSSRASVLSWPPPDDVFWMCPNCGPADYTVVKHYEQYPRMNGVSTKAAQSIMDVRVIACSRCSAEHTTTFYRDGQVRITETICPPACGFFEYSAADGDLGGWRDKNSGPVFQRY